MFYQQNKMKTYTTITRIDTKIGNIIKYPLNLPEVSPFAFAQ